MSKPPITGLWLVVFQSTLLREERLRYLVLHYANFTIYRNYFCIHYKLLHIFFQFWIIQENILCEPPIYFMGTSRSRCSLLFFILKKHILPLISQQKSLTEILFSVRLFLSFFLVHLTYFVSSIFSTAIKASCGTSTEPTCFIRFLPAFCFSSNLRLREMSPP